MQNLETKISIEPPTRMLAVVVLYRMRPCDSRTLQTLLNAVRETSQAELEIAIFVQDNSPEDRGPGELPEGIRYEAAPGNPGLANAYNRALDIASAEGFEWLLTLDQDTTLPTDFLTRITKLTHTLASSPMIGAIVPQVIDEGRNLSPFRFALGSVPRWFRYGCVGISDCPTYALNSAATLRVAALRQIGGYDPMFPLDISDINTFHQLHRYGHKVFLVGDIRISHNFSLLDKHRRMSLDRYRALLWDECAFWDMNMGRVARLERMLRLAGRALKDFLAPEEAAFRKITLTELRRRLLTSRAKRIIQWRNWALARSASYNSTSGAQNTP